jgi:hypothetical protein
MAMLKKEMAREEAISLIGNVQVNCETKLTASVFILQGLELEAVQ